MAINPEDLNVETFAMVAAPTKTIGGGGFCCTGCTSGCGINPTAGGCESASGDFLCADAPIMKADAGFARAAE